MRKSHISFIFFVLIATLAFSGCQRSREADRSGEPVIFVGSRTITLGEYKETLARVMPEVLTELNAEETQALKLDLVSRLVEEALLLDEAVKLGLSVTDEEVDAEIAAIKEASSGEGFEEAVKERHGDLKRWRETVKRELLIRKVIEQVITPRVEVTSADAFAYYRENPDEFTQPHQVRARMIVLASEEEAREVRKRITPENFAEVASEVSIGPESSSGGDLGFFAKGEMPLEFEEVVFSMRTGTISDIIKTPYGYHIFYLIGKKPGGRRLYREVKEDIIEGLKAEDMEREFEEWISSLKENTRIEIREELL